MNEPPPLPVLDRRLCTGCGDCIRICPTGCLESAGAGPWLPRPLDCLSCRLCEGFCPTGAIRLPVTPPLSPAFR